MMKALPCPPELWPRFSALLDTALELDTAARRAWLDTLPADDAALQPWLVAVLQADGLQATGAAFERPMSMVETAPAFVAGDRIGPWLLIRPLGSGGMGQVWLARRDDGAYQREVALKLPHAHLISGALQRRFARERNVLAGLVHPNIARFYDAGLGEQGQPWLALEFVDGEPLGVYCQAQALDLKARIELILQVTAAVQAAHSRLIVHRDLKPANVLVTAAGQVKLLDFGIAKLLDDEAEDGTALTQLGGRIATPDYAAPEQLADGAITVATDVYALGVMLYELLTSQRPFAPRSRVGQLLAQDLEAPPASSRVDRQQRSALIGDLDAILAKALEPDPTRRYASMESFAADLVRHLAHQPISARRISRRQRAGKFLRRNRRGVAVGGLLLASLAVGIGGVLWQAQRTAEQARRADATKDFLVSLFIANDPRIASDKPRGEITARELLELGADRVEREFADDPLTQVELYGVITDMVLLYDNDARSAAMQSRREAMGRALYGETHAIYLRWLLFDASRYVNRSEFEAADALLARIDPLLTRGGHDESELRAAWWISKEAVLTYREGSAAERRHALDEAVRLLEKYAPTHADYGTAIANRATNAYHDEDYATAKADTLRAIEIHGGVKDTNDLQLAAYWGNLGNACLQLGQAAEADQAYARATELLRRTGALDDGWYWRMEASHARAVHLAGDTARADAMFAALMPLIPADWSEYPDDAFAHRLYGERLLAEGRPADAARWLEQADREYRKPGSYPPEQPTVQLLLGLAYAQLGRADQARPALDAAHAFFSAEALAGRADTLAYYELRGRAWLALKDREQAAAAFDQVIDKAGSRQTEAVALAWAGRASLLLQAGAVADARKASDQAQALWSRATGLRDRNLQASMDRLRSEVAAAR
ncbi:serine/threonine-protein kinase [Nevskia sp.]|uniref:serine/threonine-protein kinase n=1 Tax=Nevskia sp. TaxID=1929292 RepID=UPI0025ED8B45|nr:serine/threonine-protein kinase [Nevskia sp.]